MSIEPHNCRTVSIRSVMPPKPEPKALSPKLSMAEEAKLVRARGLRAFGSYTARGSSEEINAQRKAAADAARDDLAARALALITKAPRTSGEMRAHFNVSENQMRNALGLLRANGSADFDRSGSRVIWVRKP